MASFLRGLKHVLAHRGHHQESQTKAANPALALAKNFTGNFAFLDEQTNKTHSLAISPQLQIAIDNKVLPGQVVGITIHELTECLKSSEVDQQIFAVPNAAIFG